MKIGVYLRDFFYRKVGSPPVYEEVYEGDTLVGIRYLSIPRLLRATEDALRYVEGLGVEGVEMYSTLERFERAQEQGGYGAGAPRVQRRAVVSRLLEDILQESPSEGGS